MEPDAGGGGEPAGSLPEEPEEMRVCEFKPWEIRREPALGQRFGRDADSCGGDMGEGETFLRLQVGQVCPEPHVWCL